MFLNAFSACNNLKEIHLEFILPKLLMIKGSQQMLKIGPSTSNFYVWASVLWRVIALRLWVSSLLLIKINFGPMWLWKYST